MKHTVFKKENYEVTELELETYEIQKERQNIKHKCWDSCACAYVTKCPKIRDKYKRQIDKYEFIKKGLQVLDGRGMLETFLVEECDRYVYDDPVKRRTHLNIKKIVDRAALKGASKSLLDRGYDIMYEYDRTGQVSPDDSVFLNELKDFVSKTHSLHKNI